MKEQSVNIENKNDNNKNKKTENSTNNDTQNKNQKKYKYPLTMEEWNDKMLKKYKNIEKWDSNINNCKQILNYLQRAYLSQNKDAFDLIWQQIADFITVLFNISHTLFFFSFYFIFLQSLRNFVAIKKLCQGCLI